MAKLQLSEVWERPQRVEGRVEAASKMGESLGERTKQFPGPMFIVYLEVEGAPFMLTGARLAFWKFLVFLLWEDCAVKKKLCLKS